MYFPDKMIPFILPFLPWKTRVTMSILGRDALLDTTNAGAASPQRSRSMRGSAFRPRSSATAAWGEGGGRGSTGGRTSPTVGHVRTTKRMDQEMGFLRVGTYFTVRSTAPGAVVCRSSTITYFCLVHWWYDGYPFSEVRRRGTSELGRQSNQTRVGYGGVVPMSSRR